MLKLCSIILVLSLSLATYSLGGFRILPREGYWKDAPSREKGENLSQYSVLIKVREYLNSNFSLDELIEKYELKGKSNASTITPDQEYVFSYLYNSPPHFGGGLADPIYEQYTFKIDDDRRLTYFRWTHDKETWYPATIVSFRWDEGTHGEYLKVDSKKLDSWEAAQFQSVLANLEAMTNKTQHHKSDRAGELED